MAFLPGVQQLIQRFTKTARIPVPSPGHRAAGIEPGGKLKLPHAPPTDINRIQTPDLARKLVTRYGLREKSPAPTLAMEVVPVVLVDDLIGESDLIVPRIRPAAGQLRNTSAAATNHIHLINPAASKVILHMYYFVFHCDVASQQVQWRSHADSTNTVNGTQGFRNTLLANQSPVGQVRGQFGAAISGAILGNARNQTTVSVIVPFDHVIDQGNVFTVETILVLTGILSVSFVWSEENTER